MEILKHYPLKIDDWIHLPNGSFNGRLFDNGKKYILGLTPQDPNEPDCIYFNIWIEKRIVNETTSNVVFYAKTFSGFKLKNDSQKPTPEFLFKLVEKATQEFAKEFHLRTRNTTLAHHKIELPFFPKMRIDLEATISIWDEKYRDSLLQQQPDWQIHFRDLPGIPKYKRWVKGSHTTLEQDISFKLLNKKPISTEEEKVFTDLASFYTELDKKLEKLDYSTFTNNDFQNFKNYIFYAFNYIILNTNLLTVFSTFRLVVNEWVSGKNESITDVDLLKYPPLNIVKQINKYNRANTPQTNVFYSAENIDTALKEIRPPINKIVTVGVWRPKDINKKLISFPISHSDIAVNINEGVSKATLAMEELSNYNSMLFMNYMRYYFKLLGREYTKKVNHHYEYLISSLFSEQIFAQEQDEDKRGFKFDCIIYPSVGNNHVTDNLAIRPSTLDNDFELTEVLEFEVEEAYYDRNYILQNAKIITLAKVKNFKKSSKIENGKIFW